MPLYNFECPKCGAEKEEVLKVDHGDVYCEDGHEMKKVILSTATIRKGAGLYSIDGPGDMGRFPEESDK